MTNYNKLQKRKGSNQIFRCTYFLAVLAIVTTINFTLLAKKPTVLSVSSNIKDKGTVSSKSDLEVYSSCLEKTLMNLPIGLGPHHKRKNLKDPNQVLVFAHHYDARNPQWNDFIRFTEMPELERAEQMHDQQKKQHSSSTCSVWEVGANTHANDSAELIKKYPKCDYHGYEPIPAFFETLSKNWKETPNFFPHKYGLAKEDGGFRVTESLMKSQATYIGDASSVTEKGEDDGTLAIIKSFDYAIKDAGGKKPTLLHMNCEGCEWDLLPGAIESGFINGIEVIQIGFHNYGSVGLGKRAIEYCEIQKKLSLTHELVDGAIPFAWERWVLKKAE
jgi:FkbM family methyltransferase